MRESLMMMGPEATDDSREASHRPRVDLGALATLAGAARAFAAQGRSERTRAAYRYQWSHFTAWCCRHGVNAMPAEPEVVALYLTDRSAKVSVATLSQALSAISEAHRMAGHDSPRSAAAVQEVWKGIKRTLGSAPRRVAPLVLEDLRRMLPCLRDDSVGGLRDRALLVVGFAGAFRRSELVTLELSDLNFTDDGVVVTVRRSKTDQEGRGVTVGLPHGSDPSTCPPRTLLAWLRAAELQTGPVFRAVNRHGGVGGPLRPGEVGRIVKRAVASVGLDPSKYSAHSLRAGLATTAAKAGKSDRAIMRQGRWASRGMVDRYVRDARLLDGDNAAAGIGL